MNNIDTQPSHSTAERVRGLRSLARQRVLVLGNDLAALALVRGLADCGFDVILGVEHGTNGIAEHSMHVAEVWHHPPVRDGGAHGFASALRRRIVADPAIRAIFPATREAMRWLCQNELPESHPPVVALPDPEVADICLDMPRLMDLAGKLGISRERVVRVDTFDDLEAAGERIGYPLIVRAEDDRTRLNGVCEILAADYEDLVFQLHEWPEERTALLLQGHIHGQRRSQMFAAHEGEIVRLLETVTLRTDRPDGIGCPVHGAIAAPSEVLSTETTTLAEALGYTGIGCADYVFDPATGAASLVQVTPGVTALAGAAGAMGLNLGRLALELANGDGERLALMRYSYEPGDRFSATGADLAGLVQASMRGDCGPAGALAWAMRTAYGALRADEDLAFSWNDRGPGYAALRQAFRSAATADEAEAVSAPVFGRRVADPY